MTFFHEVSLIFIFLLYGNHLRIISRKALFIKLDIIKDLLNFFSRINVLVFKPIEAIKIDKNLNLRNVC
jgi:hypothetical protein